MGNGSARKESEDKEGVVEVERGQRGEYTRRSTMWGEMTYVVDGLSA